MGTTGAQPEADAQPEVVHRSPWPQLPPILQAGFVRICAAGLLGDPIHQQRR